MIRYGLRGNQYGRLTVIGEAPRQGRRRMVHCSCVCGGKKTALVDNLRSGYTTSCGCFQREQLRKALVIHDRSYSSEHIVWSGMLGRCENPNNQKYYRYGGRGIKVCDRWRRAFAAFFKDMGVKPSAAHTLGRIDNDGDYEPSNCRWETPRQQSNNRRTSRFLKCGGVRKTVAQWSRELGIGYATLHRRARLNKWSLDGKGSQP